MGYTKIIRSGAIIEVYEYEKDLRAPRHRSQPQNRREGIKLIRPRSQNSLRRARVAFRRLVQSNLVGDVPPALFTFTMYQVIPYAASSRIFTKFAARLRRVYGSEFRYIVVPEFQKRGAVHWHALFWGLPENLACKGHFERKGSYKKFIHECEPGRQCERRTRHISRLWLRGFSDGLVTDGHPKLAGYLSKYLSKTMQDPRLRGKKAYYASHNFLRPMSSASSNEFIKSIYVNTVIPNIKPLQETEFMTEWLGKCNYKQYHL